MSKQEKYAQMDILNQSQYYWLQYDFMTSLLKQYEFEVLIFGVGSLI